MKKMISIFTSVILGAFILSATGCGKPSEPAPKAEEPSAPAAEPAAAPAPPEKEEVVAPKEAAPEEAPAPAAADTSAKAAVDLSNKGEASYTLENKKGTVTLSHTDHQEATECVTCHHNIKDGEAPQKCSNCHNGDDAPKMQKVSHKLCKDCHKEQGMETGCDSCHKK